MHFLFFLGLWAGSSFDGTWTGNLMDPSRNQLFQYALEIEGPSDQVKINFHSFYYNAQFQGQVVADMLIFKGDIRQGAYVEFSLNKKEYSLTGLLVVPDLKVEIPITLEKSAQKGRDAIGMTEYNLSQPRPKSVFLSKSQAEITQKIDEIIEKDMDRRRLVGLSFGLIQNQRLVELRGYGWQDVGEKKAVHRGSMYRWASISKPLTAVAVMQLVEQGAIKLDDPIQGLLPEFPEKQWAISTRQLLNHTAGIVHYQAGQVIPTKFVSSEQHPFESRLMALHKFDGSKLQFQPGTKFGYSTPGYAILGAIVEKAADKSYESYVSQNILNPLGMQTMKPDFKSISIPERVTGYMVVDGQVCLGGDSDVSWKLAAGGWISTIEDLSLFAKGLLDKKLLHAESYRQMWTPDRLDDGTELRYGYGFNVRQVDGHTVVSHSGGQKRTSTYMLLAPEKQLAITLMCNTEGQSMGPLAFKIFEAILN